MVLISLLLLDTTVARIHRALALLFLAYLILFLLRFGTGFLIEYEGEPPTNRRAKPAAMSFGFLNYTLACANNLVQLGGLAAGEGVPFEADQVDQLEVYTSEARIGSKTSQYDRDVERTLAAVERRRGEVRIESTQGVKPNRTFSVAIRVPVGSHDACVEELRGVGELSSYSVSKEDKSASVRQQFAERESLQAYVESLTGLRDSQGAVGELAQLESRIREVQKQILSLDVALGEFVKKESYNNINFTLSEEIPFFVDEQRAPLSAWLVAALVWTTRWCFTALGLLGLVLLTQYCVAVVRSHGAPSASPT